MTKTICAVLCIPAGAVALFAQAQSQSQGGPVLVAQGAVGAFSFSGEPMRVQYFTQEFTFNGRPITGKPYSADEKTESVQTLADGTRITNTTTTRVYRDSEGRTRREMTLPPLPGQTTPHTVISISDPVAGKSYSLDPQDRTAREMPEPMMMGAQKLRAEAMALASAPPEAGAVTRSQVRIVSSASSASNSVKHENLGNQEMEGIEAGGTRDTTVIETGQIGNDRPITITNERWFSPDLQIEVKSVHSDPRMGQTTHTVTNISRSEPDASLFQVPPDYKVEEPKGIHTLHLEHSDAVPDKP